MNEALAALTVFDPSVHLSASSKGYVAVGAQVVAGALASVFVHSSHKVEIAKIENEAKKVIAGVVKVTSLPPEIPTS